MNLDNLCPRCETPVCPNCSPDGCRCETEREVSRGVEYITDHYGSDESGDAA